MPANRIYLDHAATTPGVAQARAAMAAELEHWANPSSPHADGRAARARLEDARKRIGAALGWDGDVILTSGASEAITLALARRHERSVACSAVEHDAVLRLLPADARLPVDGDGALDVEHLRRFVGENPGAIVAVQQVNNETGVVQPLDQIAAIVRDADGIFFADCSQGAGKVGLPDADMIAVSAHKLGGPPGIGALLLRDLSLLVPTGGQEQGYRAGTENLPAAAGFAAALESMDASWISKAQALRDRLDQMVRDAGGEIAADKGARLPHIATYRIPGLSSQAQLIQFDSAGFAVSAGSACSSGTLKASHVLTAMGWDEQAAREVVRVSFAPSTTEADVDAFAAKWRDLAQRAKAA